MSSYAFLTTLAYLFSILVYVFFARKSGRDSKEITKVGIVALLGSLFGAKIFHTLFEAESHILTNGEFAQGAWELLQHDPWHWARIFSPGRVFLGGFVGATLGVFSFLKIQKVRHPLQYTDYFAPAVALGLALGRLGCFFTGCCFGRPTHLTWLSVSYTGPLAELGPLIPVQLFESAFAFICFLWVIQKARSDHREGGLFLSFILSYCVFRFFIEFMRADEERGLWLGEWLSTSQLISVVILLIGLFYKIELDRSVKAKLS